MLLFTVRCKDDDGVLFVSPVTDKETGNSPGNNEGLRGAIKSNIDVRVLWINRGTKVSVESKYKKK